MNKTLPRTIEHRLQHELKRMDRALRDTAIASSLLFSFLAISVAWTLISF